MHKTIEATVTVAPDGQISGQLPADIPPGEHHILVLLDEPAPAPPTPADALPAAGHPLAGVRARDFFAPPLPLDQLAAAQGVAPVTDFERMLGDFWPAAETTEEFLATIRAWRQEGASRRRTP